MQKGWLRPCNADDNGAFPQLESFGVYKMEVSQSEREIRSTKRRLTKKITLNAVGLAIFTNTSPLNFLAFVWKFPL